MTRSLTHMWFATLVLCVTTASGDDHWPQFRGSGALGIGRGHPPTTWDVTTGEHVAWKTLIPGLGH